MKLKLISSIKSILVLVSAIMLLAGCSSHRGLQFANREWHISNYYGQIIDKDTTYRMTFGNVLIPDPLTIISSSDSIAKYPGMDRFIADVLHTARLDSAEILFYAPEMLTMFVRPKGVISPRKPSSISSPMNHERPCTIWVHEDDEEDWTREPSEMYTYTHFNKRKKHLLIVDFYDYGETPLAQITIFQSRNNLTRKMNVKETHCRSFSVIHDMKKFMRDIEYWSNNVEARRERAFANYKIGQEQEKRRFNSKITLAQGDSTLMAGDAEMALAFYRKYLKYTNKPERSALYNAACAASLSGEIEYGMELLKTLAQRYGDWYLKEPLDKDLFNLRESEEWPAFYEMIAERRKNIEKDYDQSLLRRLTEIRRADQNVRYRFLTAYNAQPQDSVLVNDLIKEMKETDAKNHAAIDSILNEYGWPGKDKVGDECMTIWLVIQHSDIESQIKALPMLKTAVEKGDIKAENVAMLEDRILESTSKKQKYGTQSYYTEEDGVQKRVLFPIEDVEHVDELRHSVGLPPLRESYSEDELRRSGLWKE